MTQPSGNDGNLCQNFALTADDIGCQVSLFVKV
jgi:hypothetical protein